MRSKVEAIMDSLEKDEKIQQYLKKEPLLNLVDRKTAETPNKVFFDKIKTNH